MSIVPTNLINVDLFPTQGITASEILSTGLYGQIWTEGVHVSSLMEQYEMTQE